MKVTFDWLRVINHSVKSQETMLLHGLSLGGPEPCSLYIRACLAFTPPHPTCLRCVQLQLLSAVDGGQEQEEQDGEEEERRWPR